ncbi:twin-arginine translocation signal domain-containing protein [Streptosporangium sp. KLBMP 9127]|nr:twin-arginine translocation signal domain-containing protein [Streptosporangium sp. KLBMP 9127]
MLNRRGFLTAAAMTPLLAACSSNTPQPARKLGTNSKTGLQAALPTYVPSSAVKADIPSVVGSSGVATDPGFLTYPANGAATVQGVPGKGGSYTAVTPLWGTVPPPRNSFYKAMNTALGATLTMKPADGANYETIIPPMTAANRLPDWIQLPSWWNTAFSVDRLVGTQLADLTPYLAGDKVKKYPNLAALPTSAWQAGAWADKLYGIPSFSSSFIAPGMVYYRGDIFEQRGIRADEVKSVADYMALGKELTDAKRGVWAFDDVSTYLGFAWEISPGWIVQDGKLVHRYELEQGMEALEWHYQLAKAGYVHPDALAGQNANGTARFYAGKVLITGGGTGGWHLSDHEAGVAADKNFRRAAFDYISHDGVSKPKMILGPPTSVISYLNINLKPEQIEECLAIANYLAAPYGSAEYTMINFGVEGVHHTMKNGVPTPTEEGKKSVQVQVFPFLASPAAVISNPGADQVTKDYTAWQARNVSALYKPVFWNMNISMPKQIALANTSKAVDDASKACVHGKKTVAEVREVIETWKKRDLDRVKAWMTENVLNKYGTGQQ